MMNVAIGLSTLGLALLLGGLICVWRFYAISKKQGKESSWRDFGLGSSMAGIALLSFGIALFLKCSS